MNGVIYMSDVSESCLVRQLKRYDDLDDRSMVQLAKLENDERVCVRHEEISQNNTTNAHLYVVKRGWLYSYLDWGDGRRQILKVHLPGDLIGFRDIAFQNVSTTLRAAEDCVICPFPKRGLTPIFEENPRLAALLFTLSTRDQLTLIDIMKAIGHMSAHDRVLFFLLHLRARLRVANPKLTDRIRVPLNQTEIGEHLSLTNVSVSRAIAELEADGLIDRASNWFIFKKFDEIVKQTEFENRYSNIDTSWFPARRDKN